MAALRLPVHPDSIPSPPGESEPRQRGLLRCRQPSPGTGRVVPGLWIRPGRNPGSLGSGLYFLLHRRQTAFSVRAGQPGTYGSRNQGLTLFGDAPTGYHALTRLAEVTGTASDLPRWGPRQPGHGRRPGRAGRPAQEGGLSPSPPPAAAALGARLASLTFPQARGGGEVVEAQVQSRIYLRGDPQKPKGGVFEQQVLLSGRGAEELETW